MIGKIIQAAAILRSGGLVAFPTETVYGLGADATSADAVRKVFAAKGRPATNPLICHVPDAEVARRYAREWPDIATQLSERFWPGALTLVLPKTNEIPPEATAGRDTVALRAPDHPLTLMLLRVFDRPLAGPSANQSTHVSPTTAQHVRDELGDRIGMILDGGACEVGIESTVLDLSGARPTILRPGMVTREQIEQVVGSVEIFLGSTDPATAATSPGQQERHYAPRTTAYRFEPAERGKVSGAILEAGEDPFEAARGFYARLRALDQSGASAIYVEMPPDEPRWTALRDRIMRATLPLPS